VSTCRQKSCFEYDTGAACDADPDCTSTPPFGTGGAPPPLPQPATNGGGGTTTTTGTRSAPFQGCFAKFNGCNGADESTCLQHHECHAVGTPCYCPPNVTCVCGGGTFLFCENNDH
jgi:hypothetical protein